MRPDGLLTIPEAAELAGVKVYTMRRRLRALNERHGGKLLLSFSNGARVGKWLVSPSVLMELMRTDQKADDAKEEATDNRLAEVDGKLLALRGAHRKLRGRVESGFAKQERWNRNLQKWREGAEQAIKGLQKMLAAGDPGED